MSMYTTGNVNITVGKTAVVGNSTAFNTHVEVGDLFKLRGQPNVYDISAVNSATRVTLSARYISTDYQTNRASESIVTTDATNLTYTATLDNLPLIQETLSINGSSETWTDDDGSGTLTAAASPSGGSGSIDYDTGALSLTYSATPSEDYGVTASYQSGDEINSMNYQIITDFTTTYGFPELSLNDINFQHVYTKAMRLIDTAICDGSVNTLTASEIVAADASTVILTASEITTHTLSRRNEYIVDPNEADQGLAGNGATIKTYVDAIGTTAKATIVVPHSSTNATTLYILDTSETVTDNITLKIEPGAIMDGTATLFQNGPFNDPGLMQCFGVNIPINFGSGAVKEVYPEWWGNNTTPGTTLMTTAIQAAVDSTPVRGNKISFQAERYLSGKVTGKHAIVLEGTLRADVLAAYGTELYLADSTDDHLLDFSDKDNWEIRNIGLHGNRDNQTGIKSALNILNCTKYRLDNVRVRYSDNHGIEIDGTGNTSGDMNNIMCSNNDGHGMYLDAVDTTLIQGEFGSNGKSGLYLENGGNHHLDAIESYVNGENGVVFKDITTSCYLKPKNLNNNDENGAKVDNVDYLQIVGGEVYSNGQDGGAAVEDRAGIQFTGNSSYCSVVGSHVFSYATGQTYSYALAGVNYLSIAGGLATGAGNPFYLKAATTNKKLYLDNSTIENIMRWQTTGDNVTFNAEIYHKYIEAVTNSGDTTVVLPAVVDTYIGQEFHFRIYTGTNNLIIDGDGAETINGAATYTLTGLKSSMGIVAKGTSWKITYERGVSTTAIDIGVGTVKMGSANPGTNTGFIEIQDGKFVPYWTDPTP